MSGHLQDCVAAFLEWEHWCVRMIKKECNEAIDREETVIHALHRRKTNELR